MEGVLTPSRRSRADGAERGRPSTLARHWYAVPLGIFAVTRVICAVLLTLVGRSQETGTSYGVLVTNWDGGWYRTIVEHGYPQHLPTVHGVLQENQWAFYPLYPSLVRLVMWTGLPYAAAASCVSLACGAAAMTPALPDARARARRLRLVHDRARPVRRPGRRGVAGGVHREPGAAPGAGRAVGPAPPSLRGPPGGGARPRPDAADRAAAGAGRRAALGRAVAAPRASSRSRAAEAIRSAARRSWRWRRRSCSGPAVAAVATHRRDAYFATQSAWYARDAGWPTWLTGFVGGSNPALTLVVAAACGGLVVVLLRRPARLWGFELRTWAWAYPLYILGSTKPTTSIFRYALLAVVPWWPFPEIGRQRHRAPRPSGARGPGDAARHRRPAGLAAVVLGDRPAHPQLPLSGGLACVA